MSSSNNSTLIKNYTSEQNLESVNLKKNIYIIRIKIYR